MAAKFVRSGKAVVIVYGACDCRIRKLLTTVSGEAKLDQVARMSTKITFMSINNNKTPSTCASHLKYCVHEKFPVKAY